MDDDCKAVWSRCLAFVQARVNEQSFKTWFLPIVPEQLVNNTLTLRVPSQFFYEWLEEHYLNVLRDMLHHELGPQGRLEYAVVVDQGTPQHPVPAVNLPGQGASPRYTQQSPSPASAYASPAQHGNAPALQAVAPAQNLGAPLNSAYIFGTFVEGDCNQLAKSAAEAVAKKPGKTSFNPLMLYGGVGLGKTHLVQAIGTEVQSHFPEKNVLYASAEKFTNQFIEALRNNALQQFTNCYLQVDVLILDDIQFLSGKEKTQEIFFHIFNHLHQSGRQIVLTSDCPPRALKGLQERLLSRFKWGLTADLQKPDYETRVAIIHNKLENDGICLGEDLVKFIASSIDTNVRELEGVLISLIAHASLNKREVDQALIKEVLGNIVQEAELEIDIEYLQKAVVDHYGVALDAIKGSARKKEIVIARQVAMYLAKNYTSHSLQAIGEAFGGRHHSTVIHAVQAVNDMVYTDRFFKSKMHDLEKVIKMKVPQRASS